MLEHMMFIYMILAGAITGEFWEEFLSMLFLNVSLFKNFMLKIQAEYLCFGLQDTSKGVTGDDVAIFDAKMISNVTYAKIRYFEISAKFLMFFF